MRATLVVAIACLGLAACAAPATDSARGLEDGSSSPGRQVAFGDCTAFDGMDVKAWLGSGWAAFGDPDGAEFVDLVNIFCDPDYTLAVARVKSPNSSVEDGRSIILTAKGNQVKRLNYSEALTLCESSEKDNLPRLVKEACSFGFRPAG